MAKKNHAYNLQRDNIYSDMFCLSRGVNLGVGERKGIDEQTIDSPSKTVPSLFVLW